MLPSKRLLIGGFSHVFVLALLLGGSDSVAAEAPIKQSPFLPPATAAAPAQSAATAYELTGMSVAGKATLLSITRVKDKRSSWVPVGQTVGDITAVSYDPKTDQATIRADGQLLTLTLKKSSVVSSPTVKFPAAIGSKPALSAVTIPPPPATVQEEKETEARMLVTDLLEIGQEQRRAYEEAQRKAAAKGAKPAAGSR